MFRLDDSTVIDATSAGSAARFINHSCDANCHSRRTSRPAPAAATSSIDQRQPWLLGGPGPGGKGPRSAGGGGSSSNTARRIVIVASRRIDPGEELTYDYKFPVEETAASGGDEVNGGDEGTTDGRRGRDGQKVACLCGAKRCRKFLN